MELKIIKIFLSKILILNQNVITLILKEYWNLLPKKKILKDWIPLNKLDWDYLCYNKNAINLLTENINWTILSLNPNAINILENNKDKINWDCLSANRNAIDLLENNKEKINWDFLS